MPELLFAATPWLPWWTEASKQSKPPSPESSTTDILFQQGEDGYSGSPRFTNAEKHKSRERDQRVLQQKWQNQDWVSPSDTPHFMLYDSLEKLWEIGCTYTDFTLHSALFYLAFSGHVWVGLYTFPEILGQLGSLCLSDLTFQYTLLSSSKFQSLIPGEPKEDGDSWSFLLNEVREQGWWI